MLASTADAPATTPAPGRGSATGWVAVGFAGAGAALLVARAAGFTPGPCLLRTHTGIACPACGITRLAATLGQGDLWGAVGRDLPGTVLLVLVALTAVARLASLRRRPVPWLGSRLLPLALVVLLGAHWALAISTRGFTT
ncbi:MAG: hypothetical protein JWM47_1099 [Acidimicrobiales bacterium]|nr:hypothetical protein [Acidimicrobiales bacterium]